MIKKYKRKQIIVDGLQWTGKNQNEFIGFFKVNLRSAYIPEGKDFFFINDSLFFKTKDGYITAKIGDWILKRTNEHFLHYTNEMFKENFELIF